VIASKNAPENLKMDDFTQTEHFASFKSANVFVKRQIQTKFHRFGVVGVEAADSDENEESPGLC
jgi:hypothetical protein